MITITKTISYIKVDLTAACELGVDLTHKIIYLMPNQSVQIGLSCDDSYVEIEFNSLDPMRLDMNGVKGLPVALIDNKVPLNNADLALKLAKLKDL